MTQEREPDWKDSGWKHPYVAYLILTLVLFAALILLTWLAISNDWIPTR